jgi:hypothetical protein
MKKISRVFIGVLTLVLVGGGAAEAKRGPQGITKTIHNLSTSQEFFAYKSDNEDQVCVFCHTPHGGSLDGPLWNRESPTSTKYTHYNSASLSSYLQGLGAGRAVEKESLLCLSCHDGSISVNTLMNYSNTTPVPTHWSSTDYPIPFLAFPDGLNPGAQLGGSRAAGDVDWDLSDDHPISFKYGSVYTEKNNEFKDVATAEGAGIRFFGGTDKRVECSSCHDPHVMYDSEYDGSNLLADESYRPFLITSNAGSAMCLACHTK